MFLFFLYVIVLFFSGLHKPTILFPPPPPPPPSHTWTPIMKHAFDLPSLGIPCPDSPPTGSSGAPEAAGRKRRRPVHPRTDRQELSTIQRVYSSWVPGYGQSVPPRSVLQTRDGYVCGRRNGGDSQGGGAGVAPATGIKGRNQRDFV